MWRVAVLGRTTLLSYRVRCDKSREGSYARCMPDSDPSPPDPDTDGRPSLLAAKGASRQSSYPSCSRHDPRSTWDVLGSSAPGFCRHTCRQRTRWPQLQCYITLTCRAVGGLARKCDCAAPPGLA